MKKIYLTGAFLISGLMLSAQVARVPMFEIFSSSTCPPCKPASDIYNPLLDEFEGQLAVVKYPMSWPGMGDPYYMQEFDTRKNFYSVSGVPNLFTNGGEVGTSSLNSAYFEGLLEDESFLDLRLKFYIDKNAKKVYFNASLEALAEFTGGEYRLFMSINEKETFDNATTNGETEFHHICKKLLPDFSGDIGLSLGETIADGTKYDTIGEFQFVGSYRLPSGANDAIDITTENSLEETDDLEMMLWVNNMTNQEVVQAAIGVKVNSLSELGVAGGGVEPEDPTDPRTWPVGLNEVSEIAFKVYPNPAHDVLNIKLSEAADFTVTLTDLLGKQVIVRQFNSSNFKTMDLTTLPDGVYMIKVETDNQQHFDRLIVK